MSAQCVCLTLQCLAMLIFRSGFCLHWLKQHVRDDFPFRDRCALFNKLISSCGIRAPRLNSCLFESIDPGVNREAPDEFLHRSLCPPASRSPFVVTRGISSSWLNLPVLIPDFAPLGHVIPASVRRACRGILRPDDCLCSNYQCPAECSVDGSVLYGLSRPA